MAPGLAGIAGCARPFSVDQPLALRLCRHPICRPMDLPALPRNNGPLVRSRKNACSARPSRPPSNGPGKRARRLPTWPPARLNLRMKGYGGPAQPSPLLGDALNAGYRCLEVKCDGCSTHSAVDLPLFRQPGDADLATRTAHALQALLEATRLSPQTPPSGATAE